MKKSVRPYLDHKFVRDILHKEIHEKFKMYH